ncbi:hypothetical protein QBC99_000287 [Beijerinckia sp. GAS462]|nr:hypothetical protein [Beijerinckia sp. GAS462]SEB56213.1 hypothetical protein SAMN05443249_0491 [Beijerinckia sp. 28-YEA-48]
MFLCSQRPALPGCAIVTFTIVPLSYGLASTAGHTIGTDIAGALNTIVTILCGPPIGESRTFSIA